MFTKRHFLQLYFIIAVVFGVLGIITGSFLLAGLLWPTYFLINSILFFFFFLFNFLVLIEIHHRHDHAALYVLPTYNILKYIGLAFLILTADESTFLTLTATEYALAAIIFGVLELAASLAMLVKIDLIEAGHESNRHTHHSI